MYALCVVDDTQCHYFLARKEGCQEDLYSFQSCLMPINTPCIAHIRSFTCSGFDSDYAGIYQRGLLGWLGVGVPFEIPSKLITCLGVYVLTLIQLQDNHDRHWLTKCRSCTKNCAQRLYAFDVHYTV